MTATPDAYKVLQVDPEAEDEVIVAAYRRLARKYHPDAAGPAGAERMAAINAAWERLKTPEARAAYDRERAHAAFDRERAGRSASPSGPGPGAGPAPASTSTPGGGAVHGAGSTSPGVSGTRAGAGPRERPPETVSRDWSSGRSNVGGGYDASMRTADGTGAAGPPPGNPSGSVLNFGRYAGWSLGEIARRDLEYVEWLDRMPIGRPYRDEIDGILRRTGRRRSSDVVEGSDRRGLFRRR